MRNWRMLGAVAAAAACWTLAAADFPPYRPVGYDTGVRDKATGFFRVTQRDDGRWWVIDPVGRGVVLLGVDHVTYRGHWCETTRNFPHLEEMKKKFPNEEDWRKEALARLRKWGFNLLGAGSADELRHRGLIHTSFLSIGDEWAYGKDDALWICPNEGRPCSAFPNVFHPDWPKHCAEVAARKCAPEKDDPWLFGYFIDNELAWWGRGSPDGGLFDAAMSRSEGHAARAAAEALAAKAGVKPGGKVPDKVKLAFLRRAAELYFSGAAAAIRAADPNHVVMGARFAGLTGAHQAVWEVSGKYCDLVTFNCYPWADLDRNIVLNDAWSRAEPVADAFARAYSWTKKPLLVTEWSFPALDSGLPCTHGAGQRFRTQAERAAATGLFAKTMLALPYLVGYDYFMWVDEPALGISSTFPENTNYGLIDEKGEPYPEIVATFEAIHRDLGRLRAAGLPKTRAPRPGPRPVADDAVRAELARLRARPAAEAGEAAYRLSNAAGLALEGRVGGKYLFDRVTLDGADMGRFTAMLSYPGASRTCWSDIRRVEKAERLGEDRLRLTASGGEEGCAFEVTVDILALPGAPKYVATLEKIANTGDRPIEVRSFFFRQYTDFMGEVPAPVEVPALWKGAARAVWLARDGRFHGAYSRSAYATHGFGYWFDGGAHPDAWFVPRVKDAPLVLAPGKAWEPKGEIYIVGCLGFGGARGWRLAVTD